MPRREALWAGGYCGALHLYCFRFNKLILTFSIICSNGNFPEPNRYSFTMFSPLNYLRAFKKERELFKG
jgi:hypothetical protein